MKEYVLKTNNKPLVSILITTFNRRKLLDRALKSVLMQTFTNYEIFVIDDHSEDDTPIFMKKMLKKFKNIQYIYNKENMASKGGDKSIFKKFVTEISEAKYFVWLCDDDFWISKHQLKKQISILEKNENIGMVFGGMCQKYPEIIKNLPTPNNDYIQFEYVRNSKDIIFMRNVFPDGHLKGLKFLKLFADDPSNRNSVTGATIFRRTNFEKINAFENGKEVRWQSGYLMIAGSANHSDVWYLDEPCVCAEVDVKSASYRGTQLQHFLDCVKSIEGAFYERTKVKDSFDYKIIKTRMIKSIWNVYLLNKIGFKIGTFKDNILNNIESALNKEISTTDFLKVAWKNNLKITYCDYIVCMSSVLPLDFWKLFNRSLTVIFRSLRDKKGLWLKSLLS